ncbi:Dxo1p NDAI_0B05690 [Naumovozyma dairenensis CBS 421]|uniref:Decapping nuclease n=1 Tax=Naumovozyma dairenensis (strain ATCC 10597 / BCRC 20456 / CBS 421 / NBRC 0211 / NRRL Y-12639) TaxID=1071378 RepID=G0W741_NAUDC|nr:hypothetical protein NDAI_0B05690 [Naumovozyma dairenensis CBS 421]CCD23602.1 hypothetical protein NDAI_0B05690 [Naumovozyma dairenensis CBS 421]
MTTSTKPYDFTNLSRELNAVKEETNASKEVITAPPITTIPFKQFKHCSISTYPKTPSSFFETSKDVALYHNKQLYSSDDTNLIPQLEPAIAKLANPSCSLNEARDLKLPYLGSDLYDGYESFIPMDPDELDSIEPCFKYIESWELQNKHDYQLGNKFTIVSARHHIVEMTMCIFNKRKMDDFILNVTYKGGSNGMLLFSRDVNKKDDGGIYSKDGVVRKISYSGFALEDLLTTNKNDHNADNSDVTLVGGDKAVFAIIENKLNDDISLLLRCEMDSYNPVNKCFTEMKCFARLKMNNHNHRRKLLKAWVQTGVIPNSDILIGIRDPMFGELNDIEWFSRMNLYRQINNRNLPEAKLDLNYNAEIAVQWSQHCIKSICKLVDESIDKTRLNTSQSFQIRINASRAIQIKKLKSVPNNVTMYCKK